MAKKRLSPKEKAELEKAEIALAGFAALEAKFAEEAGDESYVDEMAQFRVTNVEPPTPPEKNDKNPDGLVDIMTFATHKFFCGQTLHPWQRLIFKLLYMGSEGNQHLQLENRTTGKCTDCVWHYTKVDEEKAAEQWTSLKKRPRTMLPIENSPCLRCTKFDPAKRASRFESLKQTASTNQNLRHAEAVETLPVNNCFLTESSLLDDKDDYIDQAIIDQVKAKIGNFFTELVLVIGRRGSKSFLVSIISLYECYKLLMMKHPQKRFTLMPFDEITIVNVARNEEQAKKAIFSKIKSIAQSSPYFMPLIGTEPTDDTMWLMTEADKEENKRRIKAGLQKLRGTVQLYSGHSNAAGLVGLTTKCVIIDEISAMVGSNPESGLDVQLYNELRPSMATFGDEGKMIVLSNPRGPFGKLYQLYQDERTNPNVLIVQVPTWKINPTVPQDFLVSEKKKDPNNYNMQYGAQFAAASQSPFLTEDMVDSIFFAKPQPRMEERQPGFEYYCHVDTSESSDFYAVVVCHAVPAARPKDMPSVYVDHIHYWAPLGPGQPINSDKVESYVKNLYLRFRFRQVSYDQWNSATAIANLNNTGINAVKKQFTPTYNALIYGNLYNLVSEGHIWIYSNNTHYIDPETKVGTFLGEIDLTKLQLKMLQKKWVRRKFKIEALTGYNDDITDCIAAASYECLNSKVTKRLPMTRTMKLPF